MAATAARPVLIPSPPARRHTPRIEQLFAAIAVLVDDTPTGTCMRAGCLRPVDHRSPSTWFCSANHSEEWAHTVNGGVSVLVSRLTVAESLMKSHVSDPVCDCGCIELFVALSVAASEDEGLGLDPIATLTQARADIRLYARDLRALRRGRGDSNPDQAEHPSGMPATADSFDVSGLAPPVEARVTGLYQSLRRKDVAAAALFTARDSDAIDAFRYMMAALIRRRDVPYVNRAPYPPYVPPDPDDPRASVNCRCVLEPVLHAGPCQNAPVSPAQMVTHFARVDAIDLAAVPLPEGNRRARRRWAAFWRQAVADGLLFVRRQSS